MSMLDAKIRKQAIAHCSLTILTLLRKIDMTYFTKNVIKKIMTTEIILPYLCVLNFMNMFDKIL